MIRSAAVLLVTTASLGFVSQGVAQETLAIRCGRLIDGRSDTPVSNVVIVVRGDRIVEIGPSPDVPRGPRVMLPPWQPVNSKRCPVSAGQVIDGVFSGCRT